jgi:hypothetical protein
MRLFMSLRSKPLMLFSFTDQFSALMPGARRLIQYAQTAPQLYLLKISLRFETCAAPTALVYGFTSYPAFTPAARDARLGPCWANSCRVSGAGLMLKLTT